MNDQIIVSKLAGYGTCVVYAGGKGCNGPGRIENREGAVERASEAMKNGLSVRKISHNRAGGVDALRDCSLAILRPLSRDIQDYQNTRSAPYERMTQAERVFFKVSGNVTLGIYV
jgi:hypothetical protein